MTTTFDIKTITPDLDKMTMTIYYEFSNGELFTNTVPATTSVTEILKWGQDKCTWFDQREIEFSEKIETILETNQE